MVALWGHRGYSALYPENTMLAFRKAAEAGCSGVELDVHLSGDGHLVILHDNNIARVVPGASGDVKDMNLQEIRRYNILSPTGADQGFNPIPTLEEYFECARETGLFTNIEIKSILRDAEGFAERVIACVREQHMEDRVMFSSFNHMTIARCKELAPEIACGLLVMNRLYEPGQYARVMGAEYVHPIHFAADEASVASMNAYGVGVNVWTVNSLPLMKRMLRLPIHAVMTDDPRLYHQAAAELREEGCL